MTLQQPLLEPQKEKSLTARYIEITLVVALYWIVSISMVFINKHILSDKSVNFDAPLFITFYQCLCTIIFCLVCNFIGQVRPSWVHWLGFPKLHLRPSIVKKVFPLSIVFVGMITMNNLCLKFVGVAFYFVGRSLTTVFNVILTYFILREITSAKATLCCIIIIIGFIVGVDQESLQGSLTFSGIFFGIAASFFVSLNSIFTKSILPAVDGNIWLLNFYNNVNALILFTVLITISGELPIIFGYEHLTSLKFWTMMTLSGLLAVSIGFVTGLQIKVTSPLTHNISGTAKACAQTVLACIWYSEAKSFIWWISNALVIFGSAGYTRVKQLEMSAKHSMKSQTSGA